jgi:hypothetical protein
MLPADSPAPTGYTFVGSYTLLPTLGSGNGVLRIDVYRRN